MLKIINNFHVKENLVTVIFLAIAAITQFAKQSGAAYILSPDDFSFWVLALLFTQLVYGFGGIGAHNYANHKAALYKNTNDYFMLKSLVARVYFIYLIFSPITVVVLYFVLEIDNLTFLGLYIFYAFSNIFLNLSTIILYVESAKKFAFIQFLRAVFGFLTCIFLLLIFNSFIIAIVCEAAIILAIGILNLKKQHINIFNNFLVSKKELLDISRFFIPIFLATLVSTISRLFATNMLDDISLGIYFFMFLVISIGMNIQYACSVVMGPFIANDNLLIIGSKEAYIKIFKIWLSLIISVSLFFGLFLYPVLEVFISFFPKYEAGLILLIPVIVLSITKSVDIWSIFFTMINKPQYNSYINIILLFILGTTYYIFVIYSDDMTLRNFGILFIIESIAVLITPLFFVFLKLIKHEVEPNLV